VYKEWNGNVTICEIKTTRIHVDADNLPQKWFLQAMYQAAVMLKGFNLKTDFVYVAWLDAGLNFGAQVFLPDYEFGERLMQAAEDWYSRHVIHGEPPEPTTAEDVKRMYPKSSQKGIYQGSRSKTPYGGSRGRIRGICGCFKIGYAGC